MIELLERYKTRYSESQDEEMSIEDYLDLCKRDPGTYASAAERMLDTIGEPQSIDTRSDPRLSRSFSKLTFLSVWS